MRSPRNRRKQTVRTDESLIGIKALAKTGKSLRYCLKNVAFVDNDVKGLLKIDRDSFGRFDNIELERVTVRENTIGDDYGIDLSAKHHAIVRDSELTGNSGYAALYHRLPETEIKIIDSKASSDVYVYVP